MKRGHERLATCDLQTCDPVQAGVPLIAVRCGGWGDDDFKGAVAVYDDPADLLARYNDSPLAARVAAD